MCARGGFLAGGFQKKTTLPTPPGKKTPQSLKGVSGEVIILEEAAYCDKGLIDEVVVPLLSMRSSVLLCISTLLDTGNHYSKMMSLVDDFGNAVFKNISITLVCGANATGFKKNPRRHVSQTSPSPFLCDAQTSA